MTAQIRVAIVVVAAGLAVMATLGMAVPARPAPAGTTSEVFIHCSPNASQQVDPIVKYAGGQSAHLHTPAGADAFSDSTTVAGMQASSTSCDVPSDRSLFWFPTPMTSAGAPASIQSQSYYLTNQGYALDPNSPTPNGLRFIAGNSACASTTCDTNVEYQCGGSTATKHTIPVSCPAGKGYNETIYSQNQCWDGQSLGAGMGDSTPPNVIGTNLVQGSAGQCPSTGGPWTVIPGIVWTVHVGQDGVGGFLSSDATIGVQSSCAGCTGHFDFVFGQSPALLSAVDADCLDVTGFPVGPQQTCIEKPNGDGTDGLWAVDPATGRVTFPLPS